VRLNLYWRGWDVFDVELHVWKKRGESPSKPADEGPNLRAAGHLQSSQIATPMEPDTTTFGFSRRTW
jgi:hypothetical protein